MKLDIGSMNKTWRTVGLVALAAGVLAYPAMLLYNRYMAQRKQDDNSEKDGQLEHKLFSPAYRGHHKPHRRKADANGHLPNGLPDA